MKKYNLNLICLLLGLLLSTSMTYGQKNNKYFYELKVYHFADEAQQKRVDQYLKDAYVPAIHRAGIEQVGVFHTTEDESPKTYVLVPYTSFEKIMQTEQALKKDKKYMSAGSDYLNAAHDNAPYERIESNLLHAFTDMPGPLMPKLNSPKSERVYELRSYEGATEKLYASKVNMFNEGNEIEIFNNLGFESVFYAETLFGARMPNLVYMTAYENRAERDKLWEDFRNDPTWLKLKAKDEYQNNVSKADIIFLRAAEYSDY
ncbi:NIPSNAP family protein [Catalinimonas niigatensis]|uniref:NIPSNAP family protein n=1 Tax=Catalinimonas niigatensis TaxID=1397264 RepID=UPI002666DE3B|nr:NIPSNAP family protein [Catalinimonas niigatensis]WPP49972.1 NIPSNAP family protein [Catalinimonas niigatensis]